MKIAVCDDEQESLILTKEILQNYKSISITIDCFTSGKELLHSNAAFDIILLDIDMPDLSGIETAKKIRETNPSVPILYLTDYTDYVFSAFEVHAFAYLIKPVKQMELFKHLDDLLHFLEKKPSPVLEFVTTSGIVRLACDQIFYFEYQSRKIRMVTEEGVFILPEKIGVLAARMKDYDFEMPHKSFVVHLYHVRALKGYDILMMNGDRIPLSQKKSSIFRKKLNEYMSH